MNHQPASPDNGLRVAFVTMHTSPLERAGTADAGGMNVLIGALARALGLLGVRVEFLTRRTDPGQSDLEEVAPSVTLRRLPAGPPSPLPKSEIDQHIDEFRAGMEALEPYDLVHSHHWMSGVAALPVARAWGVPHVMTFHSVAAHPNSPLRDGEPPESPARVDGEVVCAEQSDLVLCVSRHEAAVVIGRCGAAPERVRIVWPGVNVELFHPATGPWNPPGVRPGYVVFAARLQPLKAPDVAIRALSHLPGDIRPDLALIGETSADFADYEAELHSLVRGLGLEDQVHFLHGQDRASLAQIIRHSLVMLVPSYSETFGLIALEASASGIPVLAAAAGGLTEAICNTHTGLLIPTHDPRDWAAALASLLTDAQLRQFLGATGRERALTMTWSRSAESTLRQYRRLL